MIVHVSRKNISSCGKSNVNDYKLYINVTLSNFAPSCTFYDRDAKVFRREFLCLCGLFTSFLGALPAVGYFISGALLHNGLPESRCV